MINEATEEILAHTAEHIEVTAPYHVVRPVEHRMVGIPVSKALQIKAHYGTVRTSYRVGGTTESLDLDPAQAIEYAEKLMLCAGQILDRTTP